MPRDYWLGAAEPGKYSEFLFELLRDLFIVMLLFAAFALCDNGDKASTVGSFGSKGCFGNFRTDVERS